VNDEEIGIGATAVPEVVLAKKGKCPFLVAELWSIHFNVNSFSSCSSESHRITFKNNTLCIITQK
jgi:hypothetical protein